MVCESLGAKMMVAETTTMPLGEEARVLVLLLLPALLWRKRARKAEGSRRDCPGEHDKSSEEA